jgi:hypothetical protein
MGLFDGIPGAAPSKQNNFPGWTGGPWHVLIVGPLSTYGAEIRALSDFPEGFAPKGLRNSAQGFNPGIPQNSGSS